MRLTLSARRHDEVLKNLGLNGRSFADKYSDQVAEMQRSMLEFVKSNSKRSNDGVDILNHANAGSDHDAAGPGADIILEKHVKMTANGFPLIPKTVMENTLNKRDTEDILRAYLNQHYCKVFPYYMIAAAAES